MRGTPFLNESFKGLNTIDSPYTLAQGESRDLMNVVSSLRGAIKKRNGSVKLTPSEALAPPFPVLAVADNFNRTESPLSNGAKWTTVPSAEEKGRTQGTIWEAINTFPTTAGAYWNVAEQANPAVSVEVAALPGANERVVGLWACLASAAKSGYFMRLVETAVAEECTMTIERWTAGAKVVLFTSKVTLKISDSLGLSVRSGVIRAWRKRGGVWTQLATANDSTYTKGYTGFETQGTNTHLDNFSTGEFPYTGPPQVELVTIASVNVGGTPYLIAAGGTNLYSVNAAGETSIIGEGFTSGARWTIIQAPTSTEVASQGPIYLTNGIDKPQYWTGAAKNTPVAEWTGVISNPKLEDGVLPVLAQHTTLKSATAKFLPSDIGKFIKITSTVKTINPEKVEKTIAVARIRERPSPEEVVLEIEENAEWKEAYSAVKFEIERSYYEDATSKKHVPNGKYMIFAGNRVWMTGIADDPSAVRFSETAVIGEGGEQADPSSWPKENLIRFDRSDGQAITGIGVVGPYLVIFKEYKTWVIHDLNSGANRKLADTIGCVSHYSIVETVQGTFFLTADQGVYLTEGSKLREMSYNIRPTILEINPAKRSNAAGAYFNNHYYLSYASGESAVNNRTIDFDVILKSWWLHDLAGNAWVVWNPTPGETNLYTIPPVVSFGVVRAFVPGIYTDSGNNYTGNGELGAWWISSWESFSYYIFRHRVKSIELKKRVRSIFFNGSGEIIPLIYKNFGEGGEQLAGVVGSAPQYAPTLPINFSTSNQTWGNENETEVWGGETYNSSPMFWGGSAETQAARLYALGVADQWAVGWGNNSAQPFEVDAFVYNISFRKS